MSRTFTIKPTTGTRSKTSAAVDIAARFFVYKLFSATDDQPLAWHELDGMGEVPATVARAVERGWVNVRRDNNGMAKVQSASLTDEGRRLAFRGLRGVTSNSGFGTCPKGDSPNSTYLAQGVVIEPVLALSGRG